MNGFFFTLAPMISPAPGTAVVPPSASARTSVLAPLSGRTSLDVETSREFPRSAQGVEEGGDVPAVLLGDVHVGHHGAGLNPLGIANPADHVLRIVGQLAGQKVLPGDAFQRGTDRAVHGDAGNGVARYTPIAPDKLFSPRRLASRHRRRLLLDALAAAHGREEG